MTRGEAGMVGLLADSAYDTRRRKWVSVTTTASKHAIGAVADQANKKLFVMNSCGIYLAFASLQYATGAFDWEIRISQ